MPENRPPKKKKKKKVLFETDLPSPPLFLGRRFLRVDTRLPSSQPRLGVNVSGGSLRLNWFRFRFDSRIPVLYTIEYLYCLQQPSTKELPGLLY